MAMASSSKGLRFCFGDVFHREDSTNLDRSVRVEECQFGPCYAQDHTDMMFSKISRLEAGIHESVWLYGYSVRVDSGESRLRRR